MRQRVVSLSLAVTTVTCAIATAASEQKPNLAGYEKAVADYTNSFAPSYVEYDAQNFLFVHWKDRRPAFLYVRLLTVLGDTKADITARLYIDHLQNGSCRFRELVEADVSELRWRPTSQTKPARHVSLQFEGTSLDWGRGHYLVATDNRGKPIPVLIGPNQCAGVSL